MKNLLETCFVAVTVFLVVYFVVSTVGMVM